jgi:hypothetical protein
MVGIGVVVPSFIGLETSFYIPVLLILGGGTMGFLVNYKNLRIFMKNWMEQRCKEEQKSIEEQVRDIKWGRKLLIPGVVLLILGGILTYIDIELCSNRGVCVIPGSIYLGMVLMIIGPIFIITYVILQKKQRFVQEIR